MFYHLEETRCRSQVLFELWREKFVCLYVCVCLLVTFRLRQHISTKERPPLEMTTNYLNDVYWRTALTMSDQCDVTGGLAEISQSSTVGYSIVNKNLAQPISWTRCVLEQN